MPIESYLYAKDGQDVFLKGSAGQEIDLALYDTVWVPAGAMAPSLTSGAEIEEYEYPTNDLTNDALLFAGTAGSADEHAEFNLILPESWDRGTVKFKVYFDAASGASAGDYVEFYMAAGAFSNDDALDAALGAAATVEDQVIAVGDLHVTAASGALTVGCTPALDDMVHWKLSRNYDYAGAGTGMAEDARVFGVLIQFKKANAVAAW